MRVHSLVEDVCGLSWTYMHLGFSTLPASFAIPQVEDPFGHCLSSIHSLVHVEY